MVEQEAPDRAVVAAGEPRTEPVQVQPLDAGAPPVDSPGEHDLAIGAVEVDDLPIKAFVEVVAILELQVPDLVGGLQPLHPVRQFRHGAAQFRDFAAFGARHRISLDTAPGEGPLASVSTTAPVTSEDKRTACPFLHPESLVPKVFLRPQPDRLPGALVYTRLGATQFSVGSEGRGDGTASRGGRNRVRPHDHRRGGAVSLPRTPPHRGRPGIPVTTGIGPDDRQVVPVALVRDLLISAAEKHGPGIWEASPAASGTSTKRSAKHSLVVSTPW